MYDIGITISYNTYLLWYTNNVITNEDDIYRAQHLFTVCIFLHVHCVIYIYIID